MGVTQSHNFHQSKLTKKQNSRSFFSNYENRISNIYSNVHTKGNNNNNNTYIYNYNNSSRNISKYVRHYSGSLDLNIKIINGRTFLFNDDYFFPVDYEEADRLQLQHYLYIQIWESYFSSPIKTLLNLGGMNVLDVG